MECTNLTGTLELMWTHCRESLNYCRLLESTLSDLPRTSFPAIIGRRPSSDGSSGKENQMQRLLVSKEVVFVQNLMKKSYLKSFYTIVEIFSVDS